MERSGGPCKTKGRDGANVSYILVRGFHWILILSTSCKLPPLALYRTPIIVKFSLAGAHGFFPLALRGFSTLNLVSPCRLISLLSLIIHSPWFITRSSYNSRNIPTIPQGIWRTLGMFGWPPQPAMPLCRHTLWRTIRQPHQDHCSVASTRVAGCGRQPSSPFVTCGKHDSVNLLHY
jgi:hypothetical protein